MDNQNTTVSANASSFHPIRKKIWLGFYAALFAAFAVISVFGYMSTGESAGYAFGFFLGVIGVLTTLYMLTMIIYRVVRLKREGNRDRAKSMTIKFLIAVAVYYVAVPALLYAFAPYTLIDNVLAALAFYGYAGWLFYKG